MYQWCEFKSRRGKNKNLTALKSNSNTVWFNFQTYINIKMYKMYKMYRNVNICKTRHRIPVRSPENSTKYFALLVARVQMLFTFLSVFRLWLPIRWRVQAALPQTPEWTQKWPYKKDISSCEPALQTVWPHSRGFQQNENPHHWTELSVEWFLTWESGKIWD